MIIINFKNYKKGKEATNLTQTIKKYLPRAIICPRVSDIPAVVAKTKLRVFSQYLSSKFKKDGRKGSLLNHSAHRISAVKIKKSMAEAQKAGLKMILCVENLNEAIKYKKLKPWAIAYEDKKLIGSGKSITDYRREEVAKFGKMFSSGKIIPLCGAGIHSAEDIKAAKQLGCKGVIIASAIAKNKNPGKLLKSFRYF